MFVRSPFLLAAGGAVFAGLAALMPAQAEDTSRSFTIKAELRALSPGRKVD